METIYQFFIDWGYLGMFVSAFLSGSFLPFASEAILAAYIYMGLNPLLLIVLATLGNTIGGATCYGIGHLGKMEWIEKYLRIKPSKVERVTAFVQKRGAWIAFLSFIPGLGDVILVVLGLMRANFHITLLAMTIGKMLRYILLIGGVLGLASLFG
jgi:membrane protein YqaA with SNARE-associated domain